MAPPNDRSSRMRRSTTADQIKQLIIARNLKPGDPLPTESELMDTLGVSRSSVREAIRTLATLDIVTVRHGYGTYVGEMSLDPMVEALVFRGVLSPQSSVNALREVVQIRQALDLAMADAVVQAVAGTPAEDLAQLVHSMRERAALGQTFLEADRAFHISLFERTGNRLAQQLVGAFWDVHTAVVPKLGVADTSDLNLTAQAHADLLDASVRGDVNSYRDAVIRHYEPLQRMLETA